MAYTPENNPYIPGDPYSYDLKWIVAKINEVVALYGPVNNKFDELYTYVHDYFDNLDISQEIRDKIDNMIASGEMADIIAPIMEYVTPELYNAIGDGVADDTIALQAAIDRAFLLKKTLYLSGKYLITSPLYVIGVSSTATEMGSQIISNGYASIIAGAASMPAIIRTRANSDTRAYGINITGGLTLDGNNNVTDGIYIEHTASECRFENITIKYCINGMHIGNQNFYLNTLNTIRAYHCTNYGILLDGGVCTSNVFTKCYADTCRNAYKVSGQYSTMISCCADNITGIVFEINSFTGCLISCGSESQVFTSMFVFGGVNSNVNVLGGLFFGNENLSGYYIRVSGGNRAHFEGARLNAAISNPSAGALAEVKYLGSLIIEDSSIYRAFSTPNTLESGTTCIVNTRVQEKTIQVTLDSNNMADIDLNPNTYTVLSARVSGRTNWLVIPCHPTVTTTWVKITDLTSYTPSISDKNFTLIINYIKNSDI